MIDTAATIRRTKPTHFSNTPYKETPIIDPNKPEEVNEMNLAESVVAEPVPLSEVVPEDQIVVLRTDVAYQQQLESEGVTLEQKSKQVNNDLPKGVTVKDASKRGLTVKDLDRDMARIKDRAKNGGQEWNSKFSLNSLSWMQKAGKLVDPNGYKGLLDKAKDYGLDFGDELTESSFSLALIEGALQATSQVDIFEKYIEGTPLEKLFKDFLIKEAIELAAKWGSYTSVKSICQNYDVSKKTRKKCIELLFKGFRIRDEDLSDGMWKSARRVVSHFDIIYPDWDKYINGTVVDPNKKDHAPMLNGNKDLLTLLTYYTVTDFSNHKGEIPIDQDGTDSRKINVACSMQLALKLKKEDLSTLLSKTVPNAAL